MTKPRTPTSLPTRVLVLHGPNLDLLGLREPDTYGSVTLDEINAELRDAAEERGAQVRIVQSNHEGAIVERIQGAMEDATRGIIINPAAYTHTSVAIRDALLLLDMPIIEVHLSNIHKREEFRHRSLTAGVATGQITGLGTPGYVLALRAMAELL